MKKRKILIMVILVIAWMITIYMFSDMSNDESNGKSKKTIDTVVEKTLEITNDAGITNKHPSKKKMNNFVDMLNAPLRKCMHASVYFVLALLIYSSLKMTKLKNWKIIMITLIISFIYACTDEYHQSFIDGRTSQFLDVLIDTSGSIIGIILINIINKFFSRKKKNSINI